MASISAAGSALHVTQGRTGRNATGGRIQTQLPFVAHRGAVARRQAETVELQSAVDDLDPRVSPRTQLVREACAGGDPAREDLGVLMDRDRIVASVLRCDEPQRVL